MHLPAFCRPFCTLLLTASFLLGCSAAPAPQPTVAVKEMPPRPLPPPGTAPHPTAPAPKPPEPVTTPPPGNERLHMQHKRIDTPTQPASAQPVPSQADDPEYALGDQIETWKHSLKTGGIEYLVPPFMTAQVPADVTVNIHGYQDAVTASLPQATGTGTLPVSSRMKVELLAPQNPGEFTIVPGSNPAIQFVPNDSYASWTWKVTPSNKVPAEQLLIRTSLVYKTPATDIEQILVDKYYPVTVKVQGLGTAISQSFWRNPLAWFQYMLPGGQGWATLAGIFVFLGGGAWVKRKFFSGKGSSSTPPI